MVNEETCGKWDEMKCGWVEWVGVCVYEKVEVCWRYCGGVLGEGFSIHISRFIFFFLVKRAIFPIIFAYIGGFWRESKKKRRKKQ